MNRRVALISEHASPLAILGGVDSGGQNVYVGQIAKQLAERGHEVDVLTRRDDVRLPDVVGWASGAKVVHVRAGPPVPIPKEDLLQHMDEFTDRVIDGMHSRRRYDLVHANFWMSGLVAAELKRLCGTPFVITFHALGRVRRLYQGDADRFPDARFAIEDRIVAEADAVIAECPQDREDLLCHYRADPSRIVTIPCGFDPEELWPIDKSVARRALGLAEDDRIVLQLGRLVPRKGVDNAIRGFALLRHAHGVDASLLVVGGEADDPDPRRTPEIGRLTRIAREEGVDDRVTFVGRRGRDALRHYYGAADVFVTTPRYEPFGITPLEAMACGIPVVGAAVGGVKFSVEDGRTGYLVPPDDPEALAERLARLLGDPERMCRFGRTGLRRVHERFRWTKVAASVAALYERVLDTRRRARANGVTFDGFATRDPALDTIDLGFRNAIDTLEAARRDLPASMKCAADTIVRCLEDGGKVLVCGNGGSAADAQHFAAELVGHFEQPGRRALGAVALCADSAVLTAWANDTGFDDVFARQVEALGRRGDILFGISTSGRSPNVVRALEASRSQGMTALALLGGDGGPAAKAADTAIVVPSSDTQHIQEAQIAIIHLVCQLIEEELCNRESMSMHASASSA